MTKRRMEIYYPEIGGEPAFFFDGDKIITSIDGNDGNYRTEYMDCLFEHFGVEVEITKTLSPKQKKAFDTYCKEYHMGYDEEGDEDADD